MSLGWKPIEDVLYISPAADFIHTLTPPAGETFPAGVTISIKIYDRDGAEQATWPAEVVSSAASWEVDKATVAAIDHVRATFRIYVAYPDGADFVWFIGPVIRKQ